MWARHMEVVLGIWLGISRFIFHYPEDFTKLMIQDEIFAFLIVLFALLTYRDRFRYLNLLNAAIGVWLIGLVFVSGKGVEFAPDQNYMVIGLLLVMIGLVPSRTKQPPKPWVEFLKKKSSDTDTE